MSDYPSQSPWGPHGPQVSVPSTMPNPTAPSPVPSFEAPAPSYPSYSTGGGGAGGGGGGGGAAPMGGAGRARGAGRALSEAPIGGWIRNLAIAGGVLGALAGGVRGALVHLPTASAGLLALRFGLAGAAAGAGFPPLLRAAFLAARALIGVGLALALWAAALALAGQLSWLGQTLR
jgi:hypothetical protein